MKKRLIVSLLIVAMTVLFCAPLAFAADSIQITDGLDNINVDTIKNAPNAVAVMRLTNTSCKYIDDLSDMSVVVTKPGTNVNIKVPVGKVTINTGNMVLMLGDSKDKLEDSVLQQLADLQGKVDLGEYGTDTQDEQIIEEIDTLLNNYKVSLSGKHADHYIINNGQSGAIIMTNDIFKQIVEIVKAYYKDQTGKDFTSFKDLFDQMFTDNGISVSSLDSSTKNALTNLENNIDPIVEYLQSSDYKGTLIAGVTATCDCPAQSEYRIVQQYYKLVNGKLVFVAGRDDAAPANKSSSSDEVYTYSDVVGTRVTAAEYRNITYKHTQYSYVGSYDLDSVLTDGSASTHMKKLSDWNQYKKSSFTLKKTDSSDWTAGTPGLVLCYVIEENDPSPNTGDCCGDDLIMYMTITIASVTLLGAAILLRRRRRIQ